MRTRVRGWRRRPNPLRRRCDVVEGWTVLIVVVLLLVGAPTAGIATGWWAHESVRATAERERAERHRVSAVLVENAPATIPSVPGKQPMFPVKARWTEPDEGTRTGLAHVPAGSRRGDRADVWLDERGRSAEPPTTDAVIWQHTVAAGACATGGVVTVVLVTYAAVRAVATRRRLAEWEREWSRTEPVWARRWA
ncbi:Rv1733c family protein [Streptomyces sp. NPDC002845]